MCILFPENRLLDALGRFGCYMSHKPFFSNLLRDVANTFQSGAFSKCRTSFFDLQSLKLTCEEQMFS